MKPCYFNYLGGFIIIGNDNWTDSPLGISIDNRIELCSTRSKSESTENTDGKWSEWCTPFIWSKWGEDGIAGINGFSNSF